MKRYKVGLLSHAKRVCLVGDITRYEYKVGERRGDFHRYLLDKEGNHILVSNLLLVTIA